MRFGDVASLLEPDLKDGHGGLRDYDAVRWALLTDREEVARSLEGPIEDLAVAAARIAAVRGELHRLTGRAANVLLLRDQDSVGVTDYDDADDMMLAVSGRQVIEWMSEALLGRVEEEAGRAAKGGRRTPRQPDRPRRAIVAASAPRPRRRLHRAVDGLHARRAGRPASAGCRVAAAALGSRRRRAGGPTAPARRSRPARLRRAGRRRRRWVLRAARLVPAGWRISRPRRSAFHVYTVDHHLPQTASRASALVHRARPDLPRRRPAARHQQGRPGPHRGRHPTGLASPTHGVQGRRHRHPAVPRRLPPAARRTATPDLDDPRTAEIVAERVSGLERLELLRAPHPTRQPGHHGPTAEVWSTLVHATAGCCGLPIVRSETPAQQFDALTGPLAARRGAVPRARARRGLRRRLGGLRRPAGCSPNRRDAGTARHRGDPRGRGRAARAPLSTASRCAASPPDWAASARPALGGRRVARRRAGPRAAPAGPRFRRAGRGPPVLEVIVSDHDSATTMLDVRAPRRGRRVLASAGGGHSDLGLDIRSAKVAARP